MTDLDTLKSLDEKTRQLIGLYAAEKARADRLHRTLVDVYKIVEPLKNGRRERIVKKLLEQVLFAKEGV